MRSFWFGVLAGTILAAILVGVWYSSWRSVAEPPIECDVATSAWCDDTRYAHWVELEGRPSAMRVHPVPDEWAQSIDPAFRAAQWAVTVERYFDSPITAACYYIGERDVDCFAKERPRMPPRD